MFLEDLTENTKYIFFVDVRCDGIWWKSGKYKFTTTGEDDEFRIPTGAYSAGPVELDLKLIPNPVIDQLTINYYSTIEEHVNIQIANIQGSALHNEIINMQQGINQYKIDTSSLPAGMYIVNATGLYSNEISTEKLIKIE